MRYSYLLFALAAVVLCAAAHAGILISYTSEPPIVAQLSMDRYWIQPGGIVHLRASNGGSGAAYDQDSVYINNVFSGYVNDTVHVSGWSVTDSNGAPVGTLTVSGTTTATWLAPSTQVGNPATYTVSMTVDDQFGGPANDSQVTRTGEIVVTPPAIVQQADAYWMALQVLDWGDSTPWLEVFTDAGRTKKWYAYNLPVANDAIMSHLTTPTETALGSGLSYSIYTVPSLGAGIDYYFRVHYQSNGVDVPIDAGPYQTLAQRSSGHAGAISADPSVDASFGVNSGLNPNEYRFLPDANAPNYGAIVHFGTFLAGLEFGDALNIVPKTASVVRTDLNWDASEMVNDIYDFGTGSPDYSVFNSVGRWIKRQFVSQIVAHGRTPMIVLCYGSKQHDQGTQHLNGDGHPLFPWLPLIPTDGLGAEVPYNDEQMNAFGRWAAAAVASYKSSYPNTKIIWGIWNEEGCAANMYTVFFDTAAAYIRSADPDATIIGPTYADPRWYGHLEGVMQPYCVGNIPYPGILPICDGFDIHTYVQANSTPELRIPEGADDYLANIHLLMSEYSPNRTVPIVASEFGYAAHTFSEEEQAGYLVRQQLFALSRQVSLGEWFHIRDSSEGSWGLYDFQVIDYGENADPRYKYAALYDNTRARPSFYAAATLMRELEGFKFQYMLPANPAEEKMLFYRAPNQAQNTLAEWKVAAWTTDGADHYPLGGAAYPEPLEPIGSQVLGAVGHLGDSVASDRLSPSPRYLSIIPQVSATVTGLKPWDSVGSGATKLTIQNVAPLPRFFTVQATIDGGIAQVSPSGSTVGANGTQDFTLLIVQPPASAHSVVHITVHNGSSNGIYADVPVLVRPTITVTASDLVHLSSAVTNGHEGWYSCVQLESAGGIPLTAPYTINLSGTVETASGNEAYVTELLCTTDPSPRYRSLWVRTNVAAASVPAAPYRYTATFTCAAGQFSSQDTTYYSEDMLTYQPLAPPLAGWSACHQTQIDAAGVPVVPNWFTCADSGPALWKNWIYDYSAYPTPVPTVGAGATMEVFGGVLHLKVTAHGTADYSMAPFTWTTDAGYFGGVTIPYDPNVASDKRNIRPPVVLDDLSVVPTRIGMWVRGTDASDEAPNGDLLCCQVIDAERYRTASEGHPIGDPKTTWKAGYGRPVTWTGWKWISMYLNVQPHLAPLEWYEPVIVDNWDGTDIDITHITPLVTDPPMLAVDPKPVIVDAHAVPVDP
ncbi:MAG TPA: hypothetical protein VGM37_16450 [Armatimonadota bacterium]|jgi:hypothetical protein